MVITGDAWSCVRAGTLTEWVGMINSSPKVLIYSHDSFGLGHLRRCRTIAHALTRRFSDMSVLILSGSPIIGSFEFRSRVDFVRIPGVIKLRNGEYTPLSLSLNIEHILAIRSSIIEHTAKVFDPDILIVDKEPLGLRGEILGTLEMLKQRGNTRLILGLRDVMDDPTVLREEWTRKNVDPALAALDDEIERGFAPKTPAGKLARHGLGPEIHDFFSETAGPGGERVSEDFSFCRRAREAGFDIWGYGAASIGHIGPFAYGAASIERLKAASEQ